jgi:hypothetical protein
MSARYLLIGENLVDIRQLAQSTLGENAYWRKSNTPIKCICRIEVTMFVEVNFDENVFVEFTTSTIKFDYRS